MTDAIPMPLHAAYLLVAHDPATGKALVDDTHLKPGLAGAALLELTRTGALRAEGEGKQARLVATGGHVPPELAEAMERAQGRKPKDAVGRIDGASSFTDRAGRLRTATWQGLEASGAARPQEHKVLGLFPTTRWVQPTDAGADLRSALRAVVDGAEPTDASVPSLLCVAHASRVLRKLFPDVPPKRLKARAEELSVGQWGGEAVAKAISDIQASIMAATVAASSAAVAGGASS